MISTILINRNVHVLCYFPGVPLLSFSSFDTEGLRSASSLNGPRRVSRHFTCRGMLQNDHDLIVERDMPIVAYTSSLAILSRTSISLHCCFSCAPIASYAPRRKCPRTRVSLHALYPVSGNGTLKISGEGQSPPVDLELIK